MKFVCQIVIFVAGIILVASACDVNTEVTRVYDEVTNCFDNKYNVTTGPFDFIRFYSIYRLTLEEAKDKIIDYCNIFEHQYEECLRSVNVPSGECDSDKTVKSIVESNEIGFQMDAFMCENGAQRLLDFLESDGPDCFAKNDNYETCLDKHFASQKEDDFVPCHAIEIGLECVHAYEDCENQHVKIHFYDVSRQLQYLYGCDN